MFQKLNPDTLEPSDDGQFFRIIETGNSKVYEAANEFYFKANTNFISISGGEPVIFNIQVYNYLDEIQSDYADTAISRIQETGEESDITFIDGQASYSASFSKSGNYTLVVSLDGFGSAIITINVTSSTELTPDQQEIAKLKTELATVNEQNLTTMSALADVFELVLSLQDQIIGMGGEPNG